jgi:hypothetical protein
LQVQVDRARSYSSGSEGQGSRLAVVRLQRSCSQGAPASAAISAAGARHRNGHGSKQREGGFCSGGSGSGGVCSLALGEGVEERGVMAGWQSLGVVAGRHGVVN